MRAKKRSPQMIAMPPTRWDKEFVEYIDRNKPPVTFRGWDVKLITNPESCGCIRMASFEVAASFPSLAAHSRVIISAIS